MGKKKKKKGAEKFDPNWAKAKQVCRLNMEDIRMAKQLGMSPRTLMKNNPSPSQQWKAPVRVWIRELYAKSFPNSAAQPKRAAPPKKTAAIPNCPEPPECALEDNSDDPPFDADDVFGTLRNADLECGEDNFKTSDDDSQVPF